MRRRYSLSETDTESDSSSSSSSSLKSHSKNLETKPDKNGKPLKLISFEKSDDFEETLKLEVDTHVLDTVLETCGQHPISAIAVCGERKSGKSFLLNCIKNRLSALENDEDGNWKSKTISGFECKNGYKQQTEGIWIWSKAFIVEVEDKEVAVLLLDTQGINDFSTPEEISALLGLSLLLSSVTVINFMSDIPTEIIPWLASFVKFAKLQTEMGVSAPFQKLSFLVRDWCRLVEFPWGQDLRKSYLDTFLESSKDGKKMRKYWEEMESYLMPNIGSKALLNTFTGNMAELDGEFLKKVVTYVNKLTDEEDLPVKKILGNKVGAQEYGEFLLNYVKLCNNKRELEMGLRPEVLLKAHLELAEEIKIGRALTAYKNVYGERRKTSSNGFLRDATIDGLHVPAREKAVEVFRRFQLPKEKEAEMERKLDEILEQENEKLKMDNEGERRQQISQNVGKACDSLRNRLEGVFPFVPETGSNIPENMVFYDDVMLKITFSELVKLTKEEFLEVFAGDDEEETQILEDRINSMLEPIVENYAEKNLENQKNAEEAVSNVKADLVEEYLGSMQAKLKRLPNMDIPTLQVFHDEKLEEIENKFKKLNFGTQTWMEQWLTELVAEIEAERENLEMSLESVMAQALEKISEEAKQYKEELQSKAEELEDEAELENFHEVALKSVVNHFRQSCPIPETSPRGNALYRKLNTSLETTFATVVEQGIIQKRRQKEKLETEFESALKNYDRTMENSLNENDFLEDAEFKNASEEAKNVAMATFVSTTDQIPGFTEYQANLEAELENREKYWQTENGQRLSAALANAEIASSSILDVYNGKMMTALTKLNTIEELVMEHSRLLAEMELEFVKRCPSRNQKFLKEKTDAVIKSAEAAFAGVEQHFMMIKETENVNLKAALLAVTTDYFENMNRHFNNKTGFFSDQELQTIHETAKQAALKKKTDTSVSNRQVELKVDELFETFRERNEVIKKSFGNPAVGIDLGTTYCCVAAYLNGKLEIVRNAHSGLLIPSYVQINDDNTKVFGVPAKEQAYESPETTIFDAKRIIGRRWDDKDLQNDIKFWPFTVVHDDGPKIEVHGVRYYPEQISAMLLEHLKTEAEATLGINIAKAVITVPAYFTDGQRQATVRAGELAGLEVLGILNEPTAAAINYRHDHLYDDNTRNVLVFDLGGGTFDVAILEMSKTDINVLCIEGDAHLGGEDIDKNMMTYCARQFLAQTGIDLFENKDSVMKPLRDECRRRLRRLQTMCEEAKKALTTAPSKIITIAAFVQNTDLTVNVTRKTFEDLNMTLFQKSIAILDQALKSANLEKGQIDEIVLVGGSTRIPRLQKMLSEHFGGKALSKKIDPDQAVAHGAALQAAMKCAKPDERLFDFKMIQEVTPMSLGIEMANKEFDVIIPKNTKIPTTLNQEYQTHRDNQTSAWVRIFQGEKPKANDNKLLGDFTLDGIPKGRAGTERVQVTMHINANGILEVEAECKSNRGRKKITVCQERGIMTEETKQRLISEAGNAA